MQTHSQYLDYLIDTSFQGVNRRFLLSFENYAHRTSYMQFFLPTVTTKDYMKMSLLKEKRFSSAVKKWSKHISHSKNCSRPRGWLRNWVSTALCLCYYKTISIDLSKRQALDADLKAIQLIIFTVNLDRVGHTTMFFIIEEAKKPF